MATGKVKTVGDLLGEAQAKHRAQIAKANEALKKSPQGKESYEAAIIALEKLEKDIVKFSALTLYDKYKDADLPIVEIIKAFEYETTGHSVERSEDGTPISVKATTGRRQIDLLKFCTRAELPTEWQYAASKLNQLMCFRVAVGIGADVKKIADTYYLSEQAKKQDMGKTPASKTQVCQQLQKLLDMFLPLDADGNPVYKCNSHDVAFLDDVYCKVGRAAHSVKVSNDALFRRWLVIIANRIITGSTYDVEYRVIKAAK